MLRKLWEILGLEEQKPSKSKNKVHAAHHIDLKKLEKIAPFGCKVLGKEGQYFVEFYVPELDLWVGNLVLVEGNKIHFSHEAADEKIKLLAAEKGISLERTFTCNTSWELINNFHKIYEDIVSLYRDSAYFALIGGKQRIMKLLKEAKEQKDLWKCAKIFELLERLAFEDGSRIGELRNRVEETCWSILKENFPK